MKMVHEHWKDKFSHVFSLILPESCFSRNMEKKIWSGPEKMRSLALIQ